MLLLRFAGPLYQFAEDKQGWRRNLCVLRGFVIPAPGIAFWEVLVGKQPGKAATIAATAPSQLLVLHPSQGAGAA